MTPGDTQAIVDELARRDKIEEDLKRQRDNAVNRLGEHRHLIGAARRARQECLEEGSEEECVECGGRKFCEGMSALDAGVEEVVLPHVQLSVDGHVFKAEGTDPVQWSIYAEALLTPEDSARTAIMVDGKRMADVTIHSPGGSMDLVLEVQEVGAALVWSAIRAWHRRAHGKGNEGLDETNSLPLKTLDGVEFGRIAPYVDDKGRKWMSERCKTPRCRGRRICVGFLVDDDVWMAVVGDENRCLCPQCFDEIAQEKGIEYQFKEVYPVSWYEDQEEPSSEHPIRPPRPLPAAVDRDG